MKKISCLAFGPHPDDVELFCGGTLLKLKKECHTTAIVDLTRGELSTNGDIQTRQKESEEAMRILNLDTRINLELPDGNIIDNRDNQIKIIEIVRLLRPKICLIPFKEDRHPDHEDASQLLSRAVFMAGLRKIETGQEAYRPDTLLYYMLHRSFTPSFVVDISDEMEDKLTAIRAYRSQFSSEGLTETYINNPRFLESIKTKAAYLGQLIGVRYGEGYYYKGVFKINNIIDFFA